MAGGQPGLQIQPVQVRAAPFGRAPHCLPAGPSPCAPSLPESLFTLALRAPAAVVKQPGLQAGFFKPSKVVLTCLTKRPVSAKGIPPPKQHLARQTTHAPGQAAGHANTPHAHTHTSCSALLFNKCFGFHHPSSSPCESLAEAGFHSSWWKPVGFCIGNVLKCSACLERSQGFNSCWSLESLLVFISHVPST